MTDAELGASDIAAINLLCAADLCGSETLDQARALRTLDLWASFVRAETERLMPAFRRDPSVYNDSEETFRVVTLMLTLKNTLGVRYRLDRAFDPDFSDSRDQFIHGLIGDKHGGTCVSMPVLFVAVGRRLGYPLKLALAHEHVFFRWDDGLHEHINFEGTNIEGVDSEPDEHYREWPRVITDADMSRREFLVSLTPREELSVFLAARGHCLMANKRLAEARACYAAAVHLFPTASQNRIFLARLDNLYAPPRLPNIRELIAAPTIRMPREAEQQRESSRSRNPSFRP